MLPRAVGCCVVCAVGRWFLVRSDAPLCSATWCDAAWDPTSTRCFLVQWDYLRNGVRWHGDLLCSRIKRDAVNAARCAVSTRCSGIPRGVCAVGRWFLVRWDSPLFTRDAVGCCAVHCEHSVQWDAPRANVASLRSNAQLPTVAQGWCPARMCAYTRLCYEGMAQACVAREHGASAPAPSGPSGQDEHAVEQGAQLVANLSRPPSAGLCGRCEEA